MGTFCEYMNPVSVLDYRYGTEEMRNIFRADSYLGFLLDVEATLAEVQETKKIIPKTLHTCFMYKFLYNKSAIQAAID